jgi:hypothetical protein
VDGEQRRMATAVVSDGGGRRERKRGVEWKRKREQMGREPAREKYDMWTPQIFLSPVDPTLRF